MPMPARLGAAMRRQFGPDLPGAAAAAGIAGMAPEPDEAAAEETTDGVTHYRTIWISDVHLGTRGCQAAMLLDFLKHNACETLYLVGDIVDGWRLKKGWYWPQHHNDVVQKLLRRARKGTKIIYIPGNHDEGLRDFVGMQFGAITVAEDWIHTTADGKRLLVIHGDQFDAVVKYAKWLAHIGDTAYTVLLAVNTWLNFVRRRLGLTYWSVSAYLKHKVKNAVEYIGNYEVALADEARRRRVDGVVCGHIHHAEMRALEGVLYCNDGDWVESCTALVETMNGELQIIHWADQRRAAAAQAAAKQPALA